VKTLSRCGPREATAFDFDSSEQFLEVVSLAFGMELLENASSLEDIRQEYWMLVILH
jgi:hypothetical protein